MVNDVQSAVDPEQCSGEGDGIAPICHNVKIYPVEKVTIDITADITFEVGYSKETNKASGGSMSITNTTNSYKILLPYFLFLLFLH